MIKNKKWLIILISVSIVFLLLLKQYVTTPEKELNIGILALSFIGIIFVIVGFCLPNCKRNHIIGVRIKWTLENEENWNATHNMCSKLWIIGGVLLVGCIFLPINIMPWALIAVISMLVIIPVIYSYRYYKNQVKNGNYIITSISESKTNKTVLIWSILFCIVTIIFCSIICFTGKIEVIYDDNYFKIEASYWNDLTIDYKLINSIEYRDEFNKGYRVNGFGTPILSMGTFKNDEFGRYTIYSYTKCNSAIVMNIDGKIFVISGIDDYSTKTIYEEIINRSSIKDAVEENAK